MPPSTLNRRSSRKTGCCALLGSPAAAAVAAAVAAAAALPWPGPSGCSIRHTKAALAVVLSALSGDISCAHTAGAGCWLRHSRRGRRGALPPAALGAQQGERSHRHSEPSAPADSSRLPPGEADREVTAAPPCASRSTRTVRMWSAGKAKACRHCRARGEGGSQGRRHSC